MTIQRKTRFWITGLAALAALAVVGRCAGSFLVMDAPLRSDVIVVLAGETDHRPARALQLLDQGYAGRVVIDVPAGAGIFGFSEVELAQKYAQEAPEHAAIRICPIVGLSTRDESHDAAQCLADGSGSRVLIVTSDFHTRRALSIFRHEVRGKTFSVAASYDRAQFGTHWWRNRQWAKTCLDEWMKVLWWNAVDRWR